MHKKIITIGVIIAAVILGIFIFSSKNSGVQKGNNATSSDTEVVQTQSSQPKTSSNKALSGHVYIDIVNYSFSPQAITIKEGTIVTWTNKDSVAHTVTADINGPTSNQLGKGQTYSYKYSVAGIYGYHCSIHRNMTGTIIVEKI